MGNEESAQLMQQGQNGDYRQHLSSSGTGQFGNTGTGSGPLGSTMQFPKIQSLNSTISQLSSSLPNSAMRPMNQLINQLNPGSMPGGGSGQQRSGPGPGGGGPGSGAISNNAPSSAIRPASSPIPPPAPEVDLSGLTEEEKMMIQSVMARAQEDSSSVPPGGAPSSAVTTQKLPSQQSSQGSQQLSQQTTHSSIANHSSSASAAVTGPIPASKIRFVSLCLALSLPFPLL